MFHRVSIACGFLDRFIKIRRDPSIFGILCSDAPYLASLILFASFADCNLPVFSKELILRVDVIVNTCSTGLRSNTKARCSIQRRVHSSRIPTSVQGFSKMILLSYPTIGECFKHINFQKTAPAGQGCASVHTQP
jgi:hypothetical protein